MNFLGGCLFMTTSDINTCETEVAALGPKGFGRLQATPLSSGTCEGRARHIS
jgi:hypothetical protein